MSGKKRALSSRSRSGCLTCRARHIKCDETGPVCKQCIKSNKVCERGPRLNFLKCMVVKPSTGKNSQSNLSGLIQTYSFMDQSLSIHRIYKENVFHDYSGWLKQHGEGELLDSDTDLQEAEARTTTGRESSPKAKKRITPDTTSQNSFIKQGQYKVASVEDTSMSQINSDYNSDSDSISAQSIYSSAKTSVNKLIRLAHMKNIDRSLFVYSEQEPTMLYPRSFTEKFTDNSEHLTLSDFDRAIDKLDCDTPSDSFMGYESENVIDFPLFLSALVTAVKLKRVDGLFEESYLSSKVISYINEVLKLEEHQTYNNLMNYFELLLLDLNNSLMLRRPMKIKIHDESIEFILNKIISWSLFDDLNYFLINIIIILMKLNNLYYRPHADPQGLHLLALLQHLKALENNQFIAAFVPKISRQSFSTCSSHSTRTNNSSPDYEMSFPNLATVEYQNLKIRRLHIYYNFTLMFIFKQFKLSPICKEMLFKPSILSNFWNSFHNDVFQRLAFLSSDYDYSKDPFINFIIRRV